MQNPTMSPRPPVPPKDTPERRLYAYDNMDDSPGTSKRKRGSILFGPEHDLEHSAKRSRTSMEQGDTGSPLRGGLLRRKKGVHNLSSMSLRHQAKQQEHDAALRPSKFQEGSLTDKPSTKPPSTYLRDQDDLYTVERLGSEYDRSATNEDAELASAYSGAQSNEACEYQQGSGGLLFRFGQRIANAFRPSDMWTKIWNEKKEELTLQNIEKLKRQKRQQGVDAARQHTLSKRKSFAYFGGHSGHDSAISFDREDGLASRQSLRPSIEAMGEKSTLRGRLHFKRPSLGNLRFDLKRTRSNLDLGDESARASSSSTSPIKQDAEQDLLLRSQSKADLKKQHKLSKRVSDLESKLQVAREELGEALAQATPLRRGSGRHDRFGATMQRTFVPGMLPSLPSESFFTAEVTGRDELAGSVSEQESEQHVNPQHIWDEDRDRTIKASQHRAYPALSINLFSATNQPSDREELEQESFSDMEKAVEPESSAQDNSMAQQDVSSSHTTAGPNVTEQVEDSLPSTEEPNKLDTEPETPRTTANKKTRIRKRKAGQGDAAYKPGKGDSDDSELETGVTKKRKAGTRMTIHKRTSKIPQPAVNNDHEENAEEPDNYTYKDPLAEEQHDGDRTRLSIDASVHSLEPVYEEEEESFSVPVKDAPSKPTAIATPARYGRVSHSSSPVKRSTARAGAEEVMMTRAANAARKHPGRQAAADNEAFEWPEDVF